MNREEKLAFLRGLPDETISPRELAAVMGGDPYAYNLAAKAGELDQRVIPHFFRGRNLRIVKEPVIRLIGGRHGKDGVQYSGENPAPGSC